VLDELRLLIHPVIVGSGKRLFDGGLSQTSMELIESETFTTGVVSLVYRPAREEAS
jgi:dihydrofolate reductase